jgi:hypothetical protein
MSDCGEDDRTRVATVASPPSTGLLAPPAPLLVHAERRATTPSQIFLPFSSPLTQTCPVSLLRTLAAAAGEFLQIPANSGSIFRRQLRRARLNLLYIAGP